MLRPGVLSGRSVAAVGTAPALAAALRALGAQVPPDGDDRLDALVVDAGPAFLAAGGGYGGLRAGLDRAWSAIRATGAAHWIDAEGTGQLVLIAPPPGAGAHAGALGAALENLARTLGTEWARHAVTSVAVLPGDATAPGAVAELVAWLLTPAGAYLTGTALRLDSA